jgi:RNA polymerase primary sigma factor
MEQITSAVATQRRLTQELGRDATVDEVAQELGMTAEKVREFLRLNQDTVSLEQPVGDDNFSLSDLIEDATTASPEEEASKHLLEDTLRGVLGDLSERERLVVVMRFGLGGTRVATLEEVGREFGITRERVRQIEAKTMAKLRRPENAAALRTFLGVSD